MIKPRPVGPERTRGLFAGFGKTDNRIVDVEGFANWGNPGYRVGYDDSGFVGGILLGKRFDINSLPLRIELDSSFGDLSAASNRLDPVGLDETAKAEIDWVTTARAGIEQAIGSRRYSSPAGWRWPVSIIRSPISISARTGRRKWILMIHSALMQRRSDGC